tara:strand:+ start:868 stop:999 length:132 start_codon:yes stop_codon:yes gene_type:complete
VSDKVKNFAVIYCVDIDEVRTARVARRTLDSSSSSSSSSSRAR